MLWALFFCDARGTQEQLLRIASYPAGPPPMIDSLILNSTILKESPRPPRLQEPSHRPTPICPRLAPLHTSQCPSRTPFYLSPLARVSVFLSRSCVTATCRRRCWCGWTCAQMRQACCWPASRTSPPPSRHTGKDITWGPGSQLWLCLCLHSRVLQFHSLDEALKSYIPARWRTATAQCKPPASPC